MEKILVIGAGLLGNKIVAHVIPLEDYVVCAADVDLTVSDIGCDFFQMNITDIHSIEKIINKSKPDLIIHTAALTNVDLCERDIKLAKKVNVEGTKNIAKLCHISGAKLVYISTDFVFDGVRGMYREVDEPHPINNYGLTKLHGEQEICKFDIEFAIVRTSVLFGYYRKRFNFLMWVLDELSGDKNIRIVSDQFASPTLADYLATAIVEIYEKGKFDLYHVAGCERINRLNFALRIADVFGLDKSLIQPITSEELHQKALRPTDSSLCVDKIDSIVDHKTIDIDTALVSISNNHNRGMG